MWLIGLAFGALSGWLAARRLLPRLVREEASIVLLPPPGEPA